MPTRNRPIVLLAKTAFFLGLVTGCGDASGSVALVGTTTSVITMPPVRTTVPSRPGAATKAWTKWVKSFEVVDVSAISKSECGFYAMLVTEGSLTFYDWDGVQWADISSQLGGGRGRVPLKVYTHDFTNDGVLDFFVTYGDRKMSGGSTFGAYFAFPWSGANRCEWRWVDIDDGRGATKTIDSPEVDQRKGIVYANGYESGRWKTYGVVEYLPSSNSFVFREVFKK
jgi:hypothetical protein